MDPTIKIYLDYKSPFAYLALEPAFALEASHRVSLRFRPYRLNLQEIYGGEPSERPEMLWRKVRYLYADARRFANERGMIIRGPQKLFDSSEALIGGLFADRQGRFRPYSERVFASFFKRELDLEDNVALESVIEEVGLDPAAFRSYLKRDGREELARAAAEAHADQIFGVPTFVIEGERFWGYDRIPWVIKKLDSMGLRR